MTIGFIGLGRMGGPMCRNIVRAGFDVLAYDLSSDAVRACTAAGAGAAGSIAELAGAADVIFSSLPMPSDVEAAALGAGGVAAHARPGTAYFDLSTNSPAAARRIAAELERGGIAMFDAPVSGGPAGAEAGTLALMVGGDEALFDEHRTLLETIGSNVIYVGPIGSGLVVKLINNLLGLVSVAAACEGLMLGAQAGVDVRVLDSVIRCSSGDSGAYRALADRALSGDYAAAFALDLAYKDVHLALELADELGVPAPLGASTHNLMRMARGMGLGDQDPTVMMRVYEEPFGRVVRDGATVTAP
ncbi:MAG TPA: NAD(P)-dependent oxidoreductase [Solirubrobacteraceae bacterium]|nr:NAD(P)-dependent oxidoreductase [Solirubrobacteraceae bacterium]